MIVARYLHRLCQNDYVMADIREQKVARLKELMRIAKANGYAKNQAEFCEFIGKGTAGTLSDTLHGKGSVDNYIDAAVDALQNKGIKAVKPLDLEEAYYELRERVARLERALKLNDETL